MLYSFVVLVRMKPSPYPSPQEWVVILYIFTLAVEKIREVCLGVCVRACESKSECVCVRERECVCMRVCERVCASVSVCV